jgi:hypothetical protein
MRGPQLNKLSIMERSYRERPVKHVENRAVLLDGLQLCTRFAKHRLRFPRRQAQTENSYTTLLMRPSQPTENCAQTLSCR